MNRSSQKYLLIPFVLALASAAVSGCTDAPKGSPARLQTGDSALTTTLSWSEPKQYQWGRLDPATLEPPRDTTIDMSRLQVVKLGPSLIQPFEHSPSAFTFDARSLPDTSIDMRRLQCDTLQFRISRLGEPTKREVGPPRVRDGAALPILTYSQEQNLVPGTIVATAAQDAEGRMWFGTTSGLTMFDGVCSYTYSIPQGLSSNSVWSLHFNRDGTLWCGGIAGLDLIDLAHGIVRHAVGPHWFDSEYIFNIEETRSGTLLLGMGQSAGILDPVRMTVTRFGDREGLRAPSCRIAVGDQSGNYWFGTSAGLRMLDPESGRVRYFDNSKLLASAPITALHVDSHDRVWIANGVAGLWLLDPARTKFTHYTTANGLCSNDIRWFQEDRDGTHWIACVGAGGGLTHIDLARQISERVRPAEGLAGSGVTNVFQDREHQLWICSAIGGVATLNSRTGQLHHFGTTQGLAGSLPGGICHDHAGRIWIGSDQGLDILTPGDSVLRRITPRQLQTSRRVNGLYEDSHGRIWITFGAGGVSVLDPVTGWLRNYGMEQGICEYDTRKMLETPDHAIWIASITGLNRFDPDLHTNRYLDRHHGLSHLANTDLLYDSSGYLWIANGAGIDRFDLKTEEIRHLQFSAGRATNANCLLRDHYGRIWIGTNEEGIYVVDPHTNHATHVAESAGLKDLTVRSLVEFSGRVFAGMRNGLYIIDGLESGQYSARGYGERDGLINTDFQYRTAIVGPDSTLYWCTGSAVTSLRPALARRDVPRTLVTGIDLDETPWRFLTRAWQDSQLAEYGHGKSIATQTAFEEDGIKWSGIQPPYYVPTDLTLPYSRSHITFHFTANRTSGVNQVLYQYYVEGLDTAWEATTSRPFADYRAVPAGDYVFKVRSQSDDGRWSPTATLTFTITPPWYRSPWAYLLYLCSVGISIVGFVRFRHAKLVLRQHELERTVAERTLDLEEEKSRAEHSERAKQEFLANMSHEIRTPMNAVMGLTNLLIESELQPKQREYLEHIRRSSESLLIILNDILDFSKIEAGKIELEQIPIDLRDILSAVESTVLIKASDKSVAIECTCDDGVPNELLGDPTRIQQVLLNLAGNAVKFTERGSIRVACRLLPSDDDPTVRVQFTVTDTGIGMTRDQLARVFASFEQASTDTTRRYGGTGLGLTISKQLVELMGGELRAESTQGQGSTFTFSILLARPGASKAPRASVSLKAMASELVGIRILLAEDNELNRIVARDTLTRAIPTVVIDEAVNGEEALEYLRRSNYDLILMDAHMPVLDGYETASRIRTEFAAPKKDIPIVALTAAVVKTEIERCRAHGMNGYVAKPYRAQTLIATIHRVLRLGTEAFLTYDRIDRNRSVQPAFITDLNVLSTATGGDDALMRKYVGLYLDGTASRIAEITAGFQNGDMDRVRSQVHQLKAHLKMMGMALTAEIAEEIELRLEHGDPGNVLPDLIQQLSRDCEHSLQELQQYLDSE